MSLCMGLLLSGLLGCKKSQPEKEGLPREVAKQSRQCLLRSEQVRQAFDVGSEVVITEGGQVNGGSCPSSFSWPLGLEIDAGAGAMNIASVEIAGSFVPNGKDMIESFARVGSSDSVTGVGDAAFWEHGSTGMGPGTFRPYDGLYVYDRSNNRVIQFRAEDGLANGDSVRPKMEALAQATLPFEGSGPWSLSGVPIFD